jgi:tetratricopeptide (TPR) repeat protein
LHSLTGGEPDIAIDHCRKAAEIASTDGLDEIKAFADSCLAQVYMITGKLSEAIESGERALASFEALGNLWWACRTIWHLNPTAIALGQWDASLNYCRRAFDHGATLKDLRIKVVALWRTGAVYVHQGDAKRAVQYCNEALALGALPYDAAMAKAVRGYGEIKLGLFDAGITDLSEAVAWFENSRLRYTLQLYVLWLAEGRLRQGERAAAQSLVEDVLQTSRATGYLHFEGLACWLMSECLAPDAPASAESYLEAAVEIFERLGARHHFARAMVTRAALCQASGDLATARTFLDRANETFQELGTLDEPARVEAARAALVRGTPIFLSTLGISSS